MKAFIESVLRLCPPSVARTWRAAHRESGETIIEFALTALVLFTIMFGIMAFSLVMFCYLMTSQAARQGARYAMVRGNSWSGDCNKPSPANCVAQEADIQAYAQSLVSVNSNNLKLDATWLSSTGVACGNADSCKSPGSIVKVTATYTYSEVFPLVTNQSYTMTSTAEMTVIQ